MKININEERFNGENFVLDKERGVEGTLASNVKPWLKYYNIDIDIFPLIFTVPVCFVLPL